MTLASIDQFAEDLHQEVLIRAGDEANPAIREEAFTEVVLGLLSDHNEADGAEPCTFEAKAAGRSPACKLNAWALSGDGATLDVFVAKYFGSGAVESVSKPDARRHFRASFTPSCDARWKECIRSWRNRARRSRRRDGFTRRATTWPLRGYF